MIPLQRAAPARRGAPLSTLGDDSSPTTPITGTAASVLAAAAGVLVLALGVLALELRPEGSSTAAWWPAGGVAVAAVALVARGQRHLVLVAVAAGALGANLTTDRAWPAILGLTLADVLVPLLWIRIATARRADPPRLLNVDDFGRFVVATLAATGAAGLVAGVASWLADGSLLSTWGTFAAAHAAAIAVLVPLAIALPPVLRRPNVWEAGVQLVVLGASILVAFTVDESLPVGLLPLPALMWAAARLPTRWLAAELLLTAVLTSVLTTVGQGPYAVERGLDPEMVGLLLQAALVIYVLVTVPLSLTVHRQEVALATARESYELLQSVLVGATGTAIIGCDPDGTITFFNSGAEHMLGYSADEVVGRCTPELFHTRDEVESRATELGVPVGMAVFTATVDAGAASERRDWTMVRRDGSTLTVSLRVTARRSSTGELLGYLGVGEDVTERRRTEVALLDALTREREALERLAQLDQAKTVFVSSVSHELRTPMTSVLGYTDMLLGEAGGPITDQQRMMLEATQRNGQRLLRLIEDLLTVSLIENGSFTIDVEPVDLRAAAQGAVDAVQPLLAGRCLDLDVDLGHGELVVAGDVDHLERVCINLLTNAIKFTPDGGHIRVRLGDDGGTAYVEVSDTGIGVPEDEQPQLFERFYRSSTARALEVPGTGLGLSIVRSIVSAHGGEVTVDSHPRNGTTFRVLLPRRRPRATLSSSITARRRAG